jgi:very-short-patch-repair endonuclease
MLTGNYHALIPIKKKSAKLYRSINTIRMIPPKKPKTIETSYRSDGNIDLKTTLLQGLTFKEPRYFSEKFLTSPVYKLLVEKTEFLSSATISERMYYFLNDLDDLLLCPICGHDFQPQFRDFKTPIEDFQAQLCSVSCVGKHTINTRYIATKAQREKCRSMFGDIADWTDSKIIAVSEKHDVKVTCALEGCENVPTYQEKGIFHKFCSGRCRGIFYAKSGCENYFHGEEKTQENQKRILEKYGVSNYTKTEDYRKLCKTKKANRIVENKDFIGATLLSEVIDKNTDYVRWRCNECEHEFEARWHSTRQLPYCPNCHKNSSSLELKIQKYLDSHNVKYSEKCWGIITPYELDFFIPDKKVAIECHGLYYHSEKMMDKDRHKIKSDLCEMKGIHLIQIFEDEINNKWEIVESRLNNILQLTTTKIYARECIVKSVSWSDAEEFLNKNHIQGNSTSSIRYGLYFKDDLVSLMTFVKPRMGIGSGKTRGFDYELVRFCNKLNCSVVGGSSRLFTHFIRNEGVGKKIMSYADKRWSIGNLYTTLGFKYVRETLPNYWITKGNRRWNRMNFTKTKLKESFDNYDPDKTEKEILSEKSYQRIWDAGSKIFLYS